MGEQALARVKLCMISPELLLFCSVPPQSPIFDLSKSLRLLFVPPGAIPNVRDVCASALRSFACLAALRGLTRSGCRAKSRSPVEGEVLGTRSQSRRTLRVESQVTGSLAGRSLLRCAGGICVGDVHDVHLISACEGIDARGSCPVVSVLNVRSNGRAKEGIVANF